MLLLKLTQFLVVIIAFANAQRRIKGGKVSSAEKPYVVYLVKAPSSPRLYDAWLCGGAIVSEWYIITSAACVADVETMYVIPGFSSYRNTAQIDQHECTKNQKKRIVLTCVPKAYELDYAKVEKWAYIDIAVAKVDSKFEFGSKQSPCDYAPAPIPINYEPKYQEPGVDCMVLGWGHLDQWRKPEDSKDYNQPKLNYAATLIHNKEECKKFFTEVPPMGEIIDKYMICTLEGGNIDDAGEMIIKPKPVADGCTPKRHKLSFTDTLNGSSIPSGNILDPHISCEEDEVFINETRRSVNTSETLSRILERQQFHTRRQGICQNDHGGPLVTWIGSHEVLIGVASVFRVTNDSMCTGPYLYTSTQCNGAFIDCVVNSNSSRRRAICDQPPSQRGFDIITNTISWAGHPDGPAENEKIPLQQPTKYNNPPKNDEYLIRRPSMFKYPVESDKILMRPTIPNKYDLSAKLAKDDKR